MGSSYPWKDGDWRRHAYEALKALDVRHVAYVPDAGHASLIEAVHADTDMHTYLLTTEEEGVGVLAGADLGGERGVMLMQSSGVGNCPNGFSLVQNCGFPFLTLVTMRGQWGEFNPWQIPMGAATPKLFELAGMAVHAVDDPEQVGTTIEAVGRTVYDCNAGAAVLFTQRLIGAKVF